MKDDCQRVRWYIDKYWNDKVPLPGWVYNHLKICNECKEYKMSIEKAVEELKASLDDAIKNIYPPDFSVIENRSLARKRYNRLAGLAATLAILSMVMFFGYKIFFGDRNNGPFSNKYLADKQLIEEENKQFVNSIFQSSVFQATGDTPEITLSLELFDIDNTEFIPYTKK